MHVSIVMAYVNRKPQLDFTFRTFCQSKCHDFDVVVVDDASAPDQQISDLAEKYSSKFPITLIRIPSEQKWYSNPCIPYNIGFNQAKGDIVIIQNPECCHCGDIISAAQKVDDSIYVSFQTYGLDQDLTQKLHGLPDEDLFCGIERILEPKRQGQPDWQYNHVGWYNHKVFRPMGFHFVSAITRKNLKRLGGFDERYAIGTMFDDNEILVRIHRAGIQMHITSDTSVYAIHQAHGEFVWDCNRVMYNKNVFDSQTLKELTFVPPENQYFVASTS